MTFLVTIVAIALLLASALPISRSKVWWIRMFDFPRFQILILTSLWLVMAGVLALSGNPPNLLLVLLMLASLGYQMLWIYPYTALHPKEVLDASVASSDVETLKILVCNVLTSNRNAEPLKSLVNEHDPDIIATLESDQWWQDQLDSLDAYDSRLALPLDNLYGMHVYSKLPLLNTAIEYVVQPDVPSMRFSVQLAGGERVQLYIVHPAPPAPGENEQSTERDVELLLLAKQLEHSKDKIIVTGDLNDVAWSATTLLFRQISGLLDLRVGRGLFNSFHAEHWFARWPLDHVFVSSHFRVMAIKILPYVGSDHFPIFVELAIGESRVAEASPDRAQADTKLLQETLESEVAQQANQAQQI